MDEQSMQITSYITRQYQCTSGVIFLKTVILEDQFCKLIVNSIKIRFRYIKRCCQLTDEFEIGCMTSFSYELIRALADSSSSPASAPSSACVRSALTLEIFNLLPITIAILHLNMQELSLSGQQPSSGIPLPIHVLLEF